MKKVLLSTIVVLSLTACTNNPQVNNAMIGATAGAITGQVWGKNTKSTVAGAAVGGIIGSQMQTGQPQVQPAPQQNYYPQNQDNSNYYYPNNQPQGNYYNNQGSYYNNNGYYNGY